MAEGLVGEGKSKIFLGFDEEGNPRVEMVGKEGGRREILLEEK